MEYISHEGFKGMMSKLQASTPKGLLKEMHSMDHDGHGEHKHLSADAEEGLEKEGNAFTAGLAKTKKGQEFKVGGKSIKDTSNYDAPTKEGTESAEYPGSWGMKESHPGMDKWYEDFENGLQNLVKNGYIHKNMYQYFHDALDHIDPMQDYGHMPAHDAAKEFVDDLRTKDQMDADDYQWKQEHGGYDGGGDDFNDGEFWEAEVKKFQEIAGVRSHDDGPEDDDEEEREKKAKKAEMDDEEAENAEREIDEEAHADGSHMRNVNTAAKVVAEKHSAELKPLYDKYQAARKDPDHKVGNAAWKEYENAATSWCGHEMLEAGMKRVVVGNLLSGYGQYEDWAWEFMTALGEELGRASEKEKDMPGFGGTYDALDKIGIREGANYEDPYTLAKAVAEAHPELQRFALEDRKMFQRAAFKYASELMKASGVSDTAQINLINGYADEDWPSDYISALGKELEGMEEGLHMPPLQATGASIQTVEETTNETNPPYGFSVLSPDERKQLKEYIDSMKTIKKEISSLLEKAGKGHMMESDKAGFAKGGEIKNPKKAHDSKVPAATKAKYHEPNHKAKPGGNRTGLVMTKSEMWENEGPGMEKMESALGGKLHTAFHQVTNMAIQKLVADGFDADQAIMFLQHEMEEKGKEAIMAQHDPH